MGDIIDAKYEIIGLIGAGGMGKVFKAKHLRIDRFYAIKVLKDDLAEDAGYRGRFEQEAKAASRLEDAHLVAVYDYGMTPTGEPYIVMDFVSGRSLENLIKNNRPLDPDLATKVFIQICEGLEHAHSVGIIHRDLKPSNVMLTDSNTRAPVARVLDFGIAKLNDQGHTTSQSLTKTGDVFGSPQYMSPEQCQGGKADKRSDVYSMGCLMFEVLTGYPPFHADNPLATLFQHVHESPPAFCKVNPTVQISPPLEKVVLKSLAKKAEDRYQDMGELRIALSDTLTGHQTVLTSLPKAKPQYLASIAIGAVFLAMVCAGIYLGIQKHNSDALKAEIGQTPQPNAGAAIRPPGQNEDQTIKVEKKQPIDKKANTEATPKPKVIAAAIKSKPPSTEVLNESKRLVSPALPKKDIVAPQRKSSQSTADQYYKLGCKYIAAQRYGEAASYLGEAIKIEPSRADYYRQRAFCYTHLNRYSQALQDYDRLVDLSPRDGAGYARRANVLIMLNQSDRALADLGLAEKNGVRKDIVSALKGRAYHELHHYLAAIWFLKEAIRLGSKDYSNYEMLAEDFSALKNQKEALAAANQAKQLQPGNPWAYVFCAEIFEGKKDYQSAINELRKASNLPGASQADIQKKLAEDIAHSQTRKVEPTRGGGDRHVGSRRLKKINDRLWELRP